MGWIQQKILKGLKDTPESWCMLLDMTCYVFNTENPTNTQYKSVARAVKSLEKKGLITSGIWKWKSQHFLYYQHRKKHPRWAKSIWIKKNKC